MPTVPEEPSSIEAEVKVRLRPTFRDLGGLLVLDFRCVVV